MAEVDPRIRQFEQEAAKTLAAMKRSRARAEAFEAETRSQRKAGRASFDEQVQREVKKGRISEGTVVGGATADRAATRQIKEHLKEQERGARGARKEQERLTRQQDKAIATERRLSRQRRQSTRTLLSQEEALRRYGTYAGGRFMERQAERYYGVPAGGGAGGGRVPPPAPPGGGAGGGGGGGPRFNPRIPFNTALIDEQKNLKALETRLAGSTRAHQRLIQVQASGSNAMRRHGALTTEFIQAAARGETTIRELGFQTTATIGKFGGWVVAGAAIYGALGAVQALGRGALDAYSGVNELQRVVDNVDASQVRREFSDLSDYFQLPIGDVAEGAYEMGKVFHDQNTALEASESLLYSVRVGELDTATAGRYLIAITNAYNLSAEDLNSTFDKFNELQNQYGVAIKGVEAATARAGGAFVNAGGSLDYLISLIGTAYRVTGAAPERIGTAIQRSPSFIAKPKNQEELQRFGLNPEQDIESLYEEAFKKAQELGGKARRELASALFGPRYGAYIGTPLIQQQDLLSEIRKDLASSEGSGARELAELKASPEEQLKNIGPQLERLGLGLAESGLVSILAKAVLSLDDLLRLANSLVNVFADIPNPLKDALGIMIQMGIIARLLSRFNLGAEFAPPGRDVGPGRAFIGAALGGGEPREARLIRKGLLDERTTLEDERTRISDQAREQSSRAALADERALKEQQRLYTLQQRGTATEKEIADSRRAMRTYVAESNASTDQRLKLELDEEAKARRLNEVNKSIAQTKNRFGRLSIPGALTVAQERPGRYHPTSFDVPTTARPGQYGGARMGAVIPAPGVPTAPIDLSRELRDQETAFKKSEQAADRSNRRLAKLRPAAQRFGNAFNRLVGRMGTLLFAGFIVGLAANELAKAAEGVGERFDSISKGVANAEAQAERLRSLEEEATAGRSFSEGLIDVFTGGFNYADYVKGTLLEGPARLLEEVGGESIAETRRKTAETAAARLRLIGQQQSRALAEGEPVPYQFVGALEKEITKLQSGELAGARGQEVLARYRQELANSMEAEGLAAGSVKEQRQRLRNAASLLRQKAAEVTGPEDFEAALQRLQPDELEERLEAELSQTGLVGGLNRGQIDRARTTYRVLQRRFVGQRDPASIKALADARESYFDGIRGTIEEELEQSLQLARSPAERNRAYAQAFQRLTESLGKNSGEVRGQRKRVENLQRQLRKARREIIEEASFGENLDPATLHRHYSYDTAGRLSGAGERAKSLRQQIQVENERLQGLEQEQKERFREYRLAVDEFRKQQYEERASIRKARTDLRTAQTADPVAQARINLQSINREIGRVIEVYGRGSKELLDLLAEREQELAQIAQEQVNLIEATGSLRAAGLSGEGDEIAKAKTELQTQREKLSFLRANADRFSPAEIIELQAEIRSGEIDLAEQIEERAEGLELAAIDTRIARAEARGNDVRAARLEFARSRTEFRQADTPLERREQRSDLIGRRAAVRDAVNQRAIEDVQFQADIGKLTLDQQISAYRRLLSTLNLTRDQRRDLRRRVYQLRQETQEGSFDLEVGNIRLPTIYEIRRAIRGGVNRTGVTVNQRNTYQIKATDPKGTADEISRINGGANKAAMRSAGVR